MSGPMASRMRENEALAEPIGGATVACDHCQLPVPAGLVQPDTDLQFCCAGCHQVFLILNEHGLTSFYAQQSDTDQREAARPSNQSFDAWDDPVFSDLHVEVGPDGLSRTRLYLEGVHCNACVWLIERLTVLEDAVVESRLDFGRRLLTLTWSESGSPLSRVARRLDQLGYPPRPFRAGEREALRRDEDRLLLTQMGVAGAAAGNVMLIAFALYGGMFDRMAEHHHWFLRMASMMICVPATLWAGQPFFRSALGALRARTLHIDLPVSIALLAGLAHGSVNTLKGSGEVYFDTVSVLVFLLLAGRWVQRRSERRATDAAELLMTLTPLSAERETGEEVPVEALAAGDRVVVRPGASVPADGIVRDGRSYVQTAILTGESEAKAVGPGDLVFAGTVCQTRRLVIEVRSAGAETRMGRLMADIERVANEKAPLVTLADRLAGRFVAAVLWLAILCLAIWWHAGPAVAIENAVALLIVTCPCALGLATPLAVSFAIGRAARAGILVRGGAVLEALARPGTLILDKTGTVTRGEAAVVTWVGPDWLKPAVAAVERDTTHPIGLALLALETDLVAESVEETPGAGVAGTVAGRHIRVGSPRFIGSLCENPDDWLTKADEEARRSHTPVLIAVDGVITALAGIGDPLLEDAARSIQALRDMGWRVSLLSGDHQAVVERVAETLGLDPADSQGEATPESKLQEIERRVADGQHVVMVGDGVNDSGALAAATVGIAVHGGAEASMTAADVTIVRPGLSAIVELCQRSEHTVKTIRQNLGLSIVYNVVGASLALSGLMNPLVAAVLMPLSSLTVVTNSIQSRGLDTRSVLK
ncbi:MAG: Cu2+-exporting ATPase [Myxococcota bacterium]|jgi:Cu2+-exporting ATPase